MFEKEAKKWVKENTRIEHSASFGEIKVEPSAENGFQAGAEFGYNKANEWHYVEEGDLPKEESGREKVYAVFKNNSYYIVDRAAVKNYEDLIAWTELPTFKRT